MYHRTILKCTACGMSYNWFKHVQTPCEAAAKSAGDRRERVRTDTLIHSSNVGRTMFEMVNALSDRARAHDMSKLEPEEFDILVGHPMTAPFGTTEYDEQRVKLSPMLAHHYKNNRHHPEWGLFNGVTNTSYSVDWMTLIDLCEMLADIMDASTRHEDDNISNSLDVMSEKYNIHPQLRGILANTIAALQERDDAA